MKSSANRRGFLSALAVLPMVGGSVRLIGQPTAVAQPITDDLLWSYKGWLDNEHRLLCFEMAKGDTPLSDALEHSFRASPGLKWHFHDPNPDVDQRLAWNERPQPSSRAALVLSTIGCGWRYEA